MAQLQPAHMFRRGVLGLLLVLMLGGAGCLGEPVVGSQVPQEQTEPAASAAIEAMTPDAKRNAIAPSFPIEVPVPDGEFIRAQAQGDDAWDYAVRIRSSPEAVLDWYRQAYTSRQWELIGQEEYGGTDARRRGIALTFAKGNSQSQVEVDAVVEDGATTARVILGVGAPVLQTQ